MSDKIVAMAGAAILIGGPRCGFAGGTKEPLKTKDGRALVCLAQRGECRFNNRHYDFGMNSMRSWSLPQIEPNCNRGCPYRREVANPDVDTEYMMRYPDWDPYGFKYYKVPSDACERVKLEGKSCMHNEPCAQCSQPKVEPIDEWVDVVLMQNFVRSHLQERDAHGEEQQYLDKLIAELSTTPGTKAAIRAQFAQSVNNKKEGEER